MVKEEYGMNGAYKFLDSLSESERNEWLKLFATEIEKQRIRVRNQNLKAREKKKARLGALPRNPWTYSTEHGSMCRSCRKSVDIMPRTNSSTLGRGCTQVKHYNRWVRRVSKLPSYQPAAKKHPRPYGSTLVDIYKELSEDQWNAFLVVLARNEGNIRKSVSEWRSSE